MLSENWQCSAVEVVVGVVERNYHRMSWQWTAACPAQGEFGCGHGTVPFPIEISHLRRELTVVDCGPPETAPGAGRNAVVHEHRDLERAAACPSVWQMHTHHRTFGPAVPSGATSLACPGAAGHRRLDVRREASGVRGTCSLLTWRGPQAHGRSLAAETPGREHGRCLANHEAGRSGRESRGDGEAAQCLRAITVCGVCRASRIIAQPSTPRTDNSATGREHLPRWAAARHRRYFPRSHQSPENSRIGDARPKAPVYRYRP